MLLHSGSLRSRTAEETYERVRPYASRFGITRVTNVTWLDRIGIPVYASIRPNAAPGSLCVHNGKGARAIEAKVGALMEGIEFDLAEPKWGIPIHTGSPQVVEDSLAKGIAFSDLCLRFGMTIAYDDPLPCVEAIDLLDERSVTLPAELVFLPFRTPGKPSIFGSTTNGLASGNTELEARVHAVCELMERHVRSFEFIEDTSFLIERSSYSAPLAEIATRIEEAGMDVALRFVKNEFGLAFFKALVMERSNHEPLAISGGSGFHPIAEIAASRALTEAVQSRLTFIHGGRDDLLDRFKLLDAKPEGFEVASNDRIRSRALASDRVLRFAEVPDVSGMIGTMDEAWSLLVERLMASGYKAVLRVVLSPPDLPFSVVKMVIPEIESFGSELSRIGPRVLRATRAKAERSTS